MNKTKYNWVSEENLDTNFESHFFFCSQEFHKHLMSLACSTEPFIDLCDASSGEAQSIVKQMHQMLWNTSLIRSAPHEALTLQRFSFQCSLAIGNSVSQVCDQAVKAHIIYETTEKSAENSDRYFEAIFKYLTQALSKQSTCDEDSVLAIVGLVMEYAKAAMGAEKCSAFGKNNKQLMKLLEGHCDSKMVMGLKAGLKLPEMAIGLRLGKCGEDMLKKLLGVCGHVATLPNPNTVLVLGLVTTITLLQQYVSHPTTTCPNKSIQQINSPIQSHYRLLKLSSPLQ